MKAASAAPLTPPDGRVWQLTSTVKGNLDALALVDSDRACGPWPGTTSGSRYAPPASTSGTSSAPWTCTPATPERWVWKAPA